MVQILIFRRGADRWQFLAHGARYTIAEAAEMVRICERNGDRVKTIDI